jgi:hypothetical protein
MLFLFLAIVPTVLADNKVDVTLSTNDLAAYTGETQYVNVTIKNNQNQQDDFTILIWPRELVGVTTDLEKWKVTIDANSQQTVKIFFTVSLEAEELVPAFNIKVKSVNDENITAEQTLYLRIIRKTPVFIKDVSLEKYTIDPAETANININIMNVANSRSSKYYLETTIKKSTELVK